MIVHKRFLNRVTTSFLLVVMAFFSITSDVQAQSLVYGDYIPSGSVVESDILLSGTNVVIDGTVIGDVVAVGQYITINGTIEGSLIAAGQKITINGTVEGTVYSAAVTVVLGESATLYRNLYFAGISSVAKEGSVIDRDLYGLSFGATISGKINGQSQTVLGPYEIFKWVVERLNLGLTLPESLSPTSLRPMLAAGAGKPLMMRSSLADTANNDFQETLTQIWVWCLPVLKNFAILYVIGLLIIWLRKVVITGSAEKILVKPWYSLGIGLLCLVIAINLIGVALLIAALILVIGLGLGFLSFWPLALVWYGVAYSALGIATTIFVAFVAYGSKVIAAYLLGYFIITKLSAKTNPHPILSMLLGLVLYVFLAAIPMFGWVFAVLATAIGLGGAWQFLRSQQIDRKAAEVIAPAAIVKKPVKKASNKKK
jgi:cytoskeletal protein CcmA (bactofilin family)